MIYGICYGLNVVLSVSFSQITAENGADVTCEVTERDSLLKTHVSFYHSLTCSSCVLRLWHFNWWNSVLLLFIQAAGNQNGDIPVSNSDVEAQRTVENAHSCPEVN